MRRTSLSALIPLLTVPLLVTGAPAFAAESPRTEQGTFVETLEFDDTEYCVAEGVPSFHVVMTLTTDYTVFYDADGEISRLIAHHAQEDTLSANGKTLYENNHYTNVFYPDGTATTAGSHTHIIGDQGIVLHDAGRLVEDPDESVRFIAGKWPEYSGATFCQELL
ncbi:MAG: hypothetical protein ACTHKG_09640 [Nocardioides sp.]